MTVNQIATYRGKPVDQMTRDELIAAVKVLGRIVNNLGDRVRINPTGATDPPAIHRFDSAG